MIWSLFVGCVLAVSPIENGDFEKGDFQGWEASPTWVIANDTRGYYSGWQGKYWAWSGGQGEPATGVLKSKPFVLDRDGVALLISGWNSHEGSGKPRKWNYVTLNLLDGKELDRVYAPNTTQFVNAYLDGGGHKGEKVYVKAVDDAEEATYSMLCIDDVRTADLPAIDKALMPKLKAFDPAKSIRLENDQFHLEFNRFNGSLTRLQSRREGLELIWEPRLGNSFQFSLPVPGKELWQTLEANWIYGNEQKLTSYKLEPNRLQLTWKGPLKNYLGESYDVTVVETVRLLSEGVQFDLEIANQTKLPMGEVYQPFFGGLWGVGKNRREQRLTELVRPLVSDSFATSPIFRVVNNMNFLGDHTAEEFYGIPAAQALPWVGFSNTRLNQSVLIAAKPSREQRLAARFQLLPSGTGTVREDGNWPRPSELRGMPIGLEFVFVDMAGLGVGQTYRAASVFVSFVRGGALELQKAYERWVK